VLIDQGLVDSACLMKEVGIKPGWYVQHSGSDVWLEVVSVFEDALLCASESEDHRTDYVMLRKERSGIMDCVIDAVSKGLPKSGKVILDRGI